MAVTWASLSRKAVSGERKLQLRGVSLSLPRGLGTPPARYFPHKKEQARFLFTCVEFPDVLPVPQERSQLC